MTPAVYLNYFEQMARQLLQIGHSTTKKRFARINIEEVLTGLRNSINLSDWCMFLESYEGKLILKADETAADIITGAFMIVKNVQPDNFVQEAMVLDQSKAIGIKIVSRMILDKQKAYQGTAPAFMRGFDVSSVNYQKVGPLFDNAYGYRFEFSVLANENLLVSAEDWDESL
jgi:hypothetical protein